MNDYGKAWWSVPTKAGSPRIFWMKMDTCPHEPLCESQSTPGPGKKQCKQNQVQVSEAWMVAHKVSGFGRKNPNLLFATKMVFTA